LWDESLLVKEGCGMESKRTRLMVVWWRVTFVDPESIFMRLSR
jgi:hypothetical protein